MIERDIERYLVRQAKANGWGCYKWVSPGNVGVPDRILILPYGKVVFVELKTETGRLSPLQKQQIDKLQNLDCEVELVYGIDQVKQLVARLEKRRQE